MSFKPIDESKEDFRTYLARKGLLDALTKVLTKIQDLKPEDPEQFVADNISASLSQRDTMRDLEQKMGEANQENDRLKQENEKLKKEIERLKNDLERSKSYRNNSPFNKVDN